MTENNQNEDNQDLLTDILPKIRRSDLLPIWIKIFCWFFMIFGFFAILSLVLGIFGIKPQLAFYGFETNEVFSLFGIIVISVGILKGITAYSLWYEKDYAIKLAKMDTYIGFLLCIISMFVLPFVLPDFRFKIKFEIVALILFIIKLNKIQSSWEVN